MQDELVSKPEESADWMQKLFFDSNHFHEVSK